MINLYQSYYDNSQLPLLSPDCIPFDNTLNEQPGLREYPLFKKVYELEKDSGNLWGLLSFRFQEKTNLPLNEFKDWIEQNPGHDVYYIDSFLDISVEHKNLWLQGDIWHHGLADYANRLLELLGTNIKVNDLIYRGDDFITCNFFVANQSFWDGYFHFVDRCIDISKNDPILNHYMFERIIGYNNGQIPYFSFIIERLLSLYFYLNHSVNKLKFPIEHDCYKRKYGHAHPHLINAYRNRL